MNLIEKAISRVVKASRGTLSSYVVNAPHQYGQPLPQTADVQQLITPERMREVALKTPTAAALVNSIVDYVASVPLQPRNVDPKKDAPESHVKHVTKLMMQPNPRDSWKRLIYQTARDMTTLGFAAWEIERNPFGKPANLWPLDAARVKSDYDEHGTLLGWDMLDAHGVPIRGEDKVHAWLPNDVIWFQRDPQTNSIYPSSRIQQIFTCAILEDYMLAFIGGRFNDSNVPFGIYDLGPISDDELKKAVAQWNAQANTQHRIMLTASQSGGKWTPFGYQLKELEAPALLSEIQARMMAVFGVTENETGQSDNVNKSNGYNLSYTFKKRSVEPVLNELCDTITHRLFWDELGYKDLELGYEEIDSRDELLQAQIDDLYMKQGVWTVNHIRNRKGLPDEPGGSTPMVFTGAAWIPVNMVNDFALAQLYALIGIDANMLPGLMQQLEQSGVTEGQGQKFPHLEPLASMHLEPLQQPEQVGMPDSPGKKTVRMKLPKVGPQPAKQPNAKADQQQRPTPAAPTAPRGPVETLQRTGVRKDEQ